MGIAGMHYMAAKNQSSTIDPSAYKPLLETIAKGESNGNYNAHFGNSGNTSVLFTEMTVAQVIQWQTDFVNQGNPSNAVGRYQFMSFTLNGLIQKHGIDDQRIFDATLQDELAILLLERRGVRDFVNETLSREQFAANLAKEWAALPKTVGDNPEQSYYAGDGLNKVRVSRADVFAALKPLEQI